MIISQNKPICPHRYDRIEIIIIIIIILLLYSNVKGTRHWLDKQFWFKKKNYFYSHGQEWKSRALLLEKYWYWRNESRNLVCIWMTSWYLHTFCFIGPFWRESTSHCGFPSVRANNANLWYRVSSHEPSQNSLFPDISLTILWFSLTTRHIMGILLLP